VSVSKGHFCCPAEVASVAVFGGGGANWCCFQRGRTVRGSPKEGAFKKSRRGAMGARKKAVGVGGRRAGRGKLPTRWQVVVSVVAAAVTSGDPMVLGGV
jgi:hypothetical protein